MHSRFAIFMLLLSSGAYCKSPLSPVRWAFGLGASTVYMQSRYVDTEFTGIDDFAYQSKLQWLGEAKVRAYCDNKLVFGFSAGMRDAGWRKVNDHPEMEPFWTQVDYSFLYAFGDFSVGMNCIEKLPQLYTFVGFIPQCNVYNYQKICYEDGYTVGSSSTFIHPNRYPSSVYLALEYTWNANSHSVIGFQYKCELGIGKYHDVIVRSPQFQHSVGVNYHWAL